MSGTLTKSRTLSSTRPVAIRNLGQLSGKKDKIGLQGSAFVSYWWDIRPSLHRRLSGSRSLLCLLLNLLEETSKVESFENRLSRLPRLASLSRIINHCRGRGRVLIRRCLIKLLRLSRITRMLITKLPMRREWSVRKWRRLMGRRNDDLLC